MKFFIIFYNLLNNKQKIKFNLLIFFSIFAVFLELLSIGLVIPLISLILEPSLILSKFIGEGNNFYFIIEEILKSENIIYYFLLFFILLFFIKNTLFFFINYFVYKFVEDIEVNFSKKMIFRYLSQKYPYFDKNYSSILITKLSVDFHNFTRGFIGQIITITSEILIILTFSLLIIFLNLYKVGAVFLIFFLVGSILMKIIGNLSDRWGRERKKFDHLKINLLSNALLNIKNIIIDNKRDFITSKFNSFAKELASIQKKVSATKVLPRTIFEIFGIISLSSAIMFMTFFEYEKNYILTITGFFIAVAYRVVPSFQKIIYSYQTINLAKVVLKSINEDLKLNYEISSSDERLTFKKDIKLNKIDFKYPHRNNYVLKNLNLYIKKGDIIGIVGDSGEGKSTLVDIISCLVPYEKGNITIDDLDLTNDTLIRKWQNQISYVTQNTFLFNDTIKENIIFSSNEKNVDEVYLKEIIKKTQIDEFINNLPDKIHTNIGDMGSKLSGGQKKRIGIARALYKRPEVLIFDEATNGLDKETEQKILSMIYSLGSKMTIIMITHNIEILREAKSVFKLSDGKLNNINGNS